MMPFPLIRMVSLKNGDEFNPCDTIKGLNPVDVNDPFTDAYEGCKPEVIIEGGGGVGAYGSTYYRT